MKALVIKNLKKIYNSGAVALKGIDLEVDDGDFYALLGPNGAGKSTTIGILCSLINKTSGKVWVHGKDIDTHLKEAKSYIGLVPQEFNFNVFEPVIEVVVNQAGYYGIERQTALHYAEKLLKQLGLWEKRHTMARELSGGMKRRLMITRALVHNPRLLILDEPTAGVDVETRHSLWKFLRLININGTTIILTTHYLEEAEMLCKSIAVIDNGVILKSATMKEFLNEDNTETFVLHLKEKIVSLPSIDGYVFHQIDDTAVEIEMPRTVSMNQLFQDISKAGIEVSSMRNKANRLEQVFMGLVSENNKR